MIVRRYQAGDFAAVDALWRTCFPADPQRNRAAVAIPAKLAMDDCLFWVAEDGDAVVGTIMAGYDGHRGWLYAVATDPRSRRQGIGRTLVEHAVAGLRDAGCAKVNLQIRADNAVVAAFYASLGFAEEPRISMGRLI